MLKIVTPLITDINDKAQLESYILRTMPNLSSMDLSAVLSELLNKFRKTTPNNPNTLKELFNMSVSLYKSYGYSCLFRFLSLCPEKKLEIKKMVLDTVQDKNTSQDRASILEIFISYLVNGEQPSKDDLLELLFVIKGSFSIKEQIFFYKKFFPFLSSEQVCLISKGIIGQLSKTMPYSEHYLALLAILENLPISILEKEQMSYNALTLLELIARPNQKQQNDQSKITFEDKARLIKFLAEEQIIEIVELLEREIGRIESLAERLINLTVLFNYCAPRDKDIADCLKQRIEEQFATINKIKLPSYSSLSTDLISYNFDWAVKFLNKIKDDFILADTCITLMARSSTINESQKKVLHDLALKTIKNMSSHKLIAFSNISRLLTVNEKRDFLKSLLANTTRNDLEDLVPRELGQILLDLDKDLITQLFDLAKKLTSERKMSNLLCFLPYLEDKEREVLIKEALATLAQLNRQGLTHNEYGDIVELLARHAL